MARALAKLQGCGYQRDQFLHGHREKLAALAARYAIPTIYPWRDYVAVGVLMNYGAALLEASKLIGTYSGKILRGVDPAELLVEQHTKVEFAINLKTAKTLDVKSPKAAGRAEEAIIQATAACMARD